MRVSSEKNSRFPVNTRSTSKKLRTQRQLPGKAHCHINSSILDFRCIGWWMYTPLPNATCKWMLSSLRRQLTRCLINDHEKWWFGKCGGIKKAAFIVNNRKIRRLCRKAGPRKSRLGGWSGIPLEYPFTLRIFGWRRKLCGSVYVVRMHRRPSTYVCKWTSADRCRSPHRDWEWSGI